jgi:hypothetical protein
MLQLAGSAMSYKRQERNGGGNRKRVERGGKSRSSVYLFFVR